MKRLFDIVLSFMIMILFFPLFLFIVFLVAISSKGPIIYHCKRVKKNFGLFNCYKFRTMYLDADQRLKTILSQNPEIKKEWDLYQKLKKDPRITPIGKFLRKTSLDELPQLFNVLIGDMSLVGPRPYMFFGKEQEFKKELISLYGKEIETILTKNPGMTGLWQISGRNNLPLTKRIQLDIKYVKTCSLKDDFYILAKTIPQVIWAKGAY